MHANEHRTHCPFCALQCAMRIHSDGDGGGGTHSVVGDADFEVNAGQLCIKGAESAALLTRADRILQPMLRDAAGKLQPCTWESAIAMTAQRLRRLRDAHGASSVGVFGSGALTNEKAYALGKFARIVLETPNIDYNGRFCMSSAAAAQNRAFGMDRGLPFPISDIAEADCIVSWGSNWAETMPPIRRWFDRQKERGGRLIVVDPRRTATATLGQLFVQPVPGTDLALANGLLYLAIEGGHVDLDYVERRTSGFEAVKRVAGWYSPDRVERITGVSEATMRKMVAWMIEKPKALLLSGRGAEQQSKGTDTVHAFINLMLALGRVGQPASGYACLTGQGNGQGGREHGQKADQLPGYRSIENSEHRALVSKAWGIAESRLPRKGKSAYELLDSMGQSGDSESSIFGMLVMGSNVAVATPNAERIRHRLSKLDFLCVIDTFPNETTEFADVVLPSLLWSEESGTMTNLEGRVILRRQLTQPPLGPRSDLDILRCLAQELDCPTFLRTSDPAHVFDELAQITQGAIADYSGLTHARLSESQGIHWPCPAPNHPGTARVFCDTFEHPDGKARFYPVEHRAAVESPDDDFPLYFTTGRWREHYNSGAQTRGIKELSERRSEAVLEVHPSCLGRYGLTHQSHAWIETRRARLHVRLQPSPSIRVDTVFMPFHFGGAQSANLLVGAGLDPTSRMPEFKICAARISGVDR